MCFTLIILVIISCNDLKEIKRDRFFKKYHDYNH